MKLERVDESRGVAHHGDDVADVVPRLPRNPSRRAETVGNLEVTFTWKDYADHDRIREMTLSGEEFLRRFLLHVLPDRFVRIRYYGLLVNRHRQKALELCRKVLPGPPARKVQKID